MVSHLPPLPPTVGNGRANRPHPDILPARGRRLLVLSDSHRESARLGPVLTSQHEIQVIRAALLYAVENAPTTDQAHLTYLMVELERVKERLSDSLPSPALKAHLQQGREGLDSDIAEAKAGGSVKDWVARVRELDWDPVGQLLDPGHAPEYKANKWNGSDWATNRTELERSPPRLIGREFFGPGGVLPNLEALGLVVVGYPGINTLKVPDAFAMGLPADVLTQLSQNCQR